MFLCLKSYIEEWRVDGLKNVIFLLKEVFIWVVHQRILTHASNASCLRQKLKLHRIIRFQFVLHDEPLEAMQTFKNL